MRIIVNRLPNKFYSNYKQVIIRFLDLGEERTRALITKVLEMEESEADKTLTYTLREFSKRHRNLTHKFLKTFTQSHHSGRNDPALPSPHADLFF